MTKTKPIGIGVGIGILALIIFYASSQVGDVKVEYSVLESELASSAIDWNYYDLLKNIDDLEGQVIHFTGTVNVASKNGVFGINVGESSINQDVIFIEYDKDEFVKRDVVDGYGSVKGIRNLEKVNSVGGSDILEQVPNIEGILISCTSC